MRGMGQPKYGALGASLVVAHAFRPSDYDFLWDDSLRGFGVVAFRNGGKCYVVQYRQHGRSRRARIGDHPSLTPAEARSKPNWRAGRAAGIDDAGRTRGDGRVSAQGVATCHVKPTLTLVRGLDTKQGSRRKRTSRPRHASNLAGALDEDGR